MATLPTVQDFGRRPTPSAPRGVASVSPRGASAVADAVSSLGNDISNIGFEAIDREATAAAKERDAAVSDQIRTLLYDPQSGFMNLEGGSAVQKREDVFSRLDALKSSAVDGLSRPAQKKLADALRNRIESAKQSIDVHTSGARKSWIDGASAARIESAYQDSLADPASTDLHINTIVGELRGQAVRDGWAPERLDLEVTKATSKVYNDQTLRIASSDPVAAIQYLRDKQGQMLPSDVVNLEAKLQPAVKEFIGWQKGREIFAQQSAPAIASFNALEDAVGFPLKVNSAFRDRGRNAAVGGARDSQHTHGNAFDIDVSGMSVDQRKAVIVAARKAGFSGIGVYDNALHFDVGGDRAWGPSFGRESLPEWAADVVRSPIGEQPSMWDTVLAEEDPDIRKSMVDAIGLEQSVRDGQRKANVAAARDAAFQMIEGGGRLNDLPLEQRQALGEEAMSALTIYEAKKNAGTPIETDPNVYLGLSQMRANDPEAFRQVDMTAFVDRLEETVWRGFVDSQNKPRDNVTALAASTLMSVAEARMSAVGIDPTPKDGTDDSRRVAEIQTQLLQWQERFIKDNGEAPPQIEIDRRIARMLTEVRVNDTIGPLFDTGKVRLFDIIAMAEAGTLKGEVTIGATTYDGERVSEAVNALNGAGLPVTSENIAIIMSEVER